MQALQATEREDTCVRLHSQLCSWDGMCLCQCAQKDDGPRTRFVKKVWAQAWSSDQKNSTITREFLSTKTLQMVAMTLWPLHRYVLWKLLFLSVSLNLLWYLHGLLSYSLCTQLGQNMKFSPLSKHHAFFPTESLDHNQNRLWTATVVSIRPWVKYSVTAFLTKVISCSIFFLSFTRYLSLCVCSIGFLCYST